MALTVAALALGGLGLAGLPVLAAVGIAIGAEVGTKLGMAAMACFGRAAYEGMGEQFTDVSTAGSFLAPATIVLPAAVFGWPHPGVVALPGAVAGIALPWYWRIARWGASTATSSAQQRDRPRRRRSRGGDRVDALVMCGGKGTRLESPHEKPLHPIDGTAMVDRVRAALEASRVETIAAAVSPNAPATRSHLEERDGVATIETAGEGYVTDLLAALERPELSPPLLTVAADLPLLEAAVVDRILAAHGNAEARAPSAFPWHSNGGSASASTRDSSPTTTSRRPGSTWSAPRTNPRR